MKRSVIAQMASLVAACTLVLLAVVTASAAPTMTQTIQLQSGWNSVYLEVTPANVDPAAVFAGMPVESVWTYLGRNSTIEYINSPSEGLWGKAGWHVFVPGKPNLTDLYAITANHAYLIKISEPFTWNVTGTPTANGTTWVPDSFNLTGFHLESFGAPTFDAFLAPSTAHRGQAYYQLSSAGVWTFINSPAAVSLKQGEAYWVYCNGGSTYQGPLAVELGGGDDIDFGAELNRFSVTLTNLAAVARTATLEMSPAAAVPVEWGSYNATTGLIDYVPLNPNVSVPLAAGEKRTITLYLRRASMTADGEALLKIGDGAGMRLLVPVSAKK